MEIFKYYGTYQNKVYEVSNLGNVKINGTIKPLNELSHWGVYLELWWHQTVHKAVAYLFVENQLNKPEVDHIDGNPLNNKASNLRWCTHSENLNNPVTKQRMKDAQKNYWSNIDNRIKTSVKTKEAMKDPKIREACRRGGLKGKGRKKSEIHKKHLSESHKGIKHTEEVKNKISEKVKDSMKDPKIREACRRGGLHTTGLKWMNNGFSTIRVELQDIPEKIKLGYVLGRGKFKTKI